MTTCYILRLGHLADTLVPHSCGGWVNGQNWKARPVCHLCVHPGRWHDSRVAYVCVTKQTLAFWPVYPVIVRNLFMHVEGVWRWTLRQSSCSPVSAVRRASPPSVPVSQSERSCQARLNEQRLDLWPDRSICKRTPQALFWGRCPQTMKENHLRERWGVMLLFMGSWVSAFFSWSLSVYFNYLLVGEMSSSDFRDAELSLFLNAICDVTYNPKFNPRKTVCVSVSCMTKEADSTQMTDCPLCCFLLYIYWHLQF